MIRVILTLYFFGFFSGQVYGQVTSSRLTESDIFQVVPVIIGDVKASALEEELGTDDIEGYIKRGYDRLLASNYNEAIDNFNKAITTYPDIAVAYYYRGVAKKEQGNYEGARVDLSEAVAKDPLLFDARLELGSVEMLLGNKIYARKHFEIVKKALPKSPLPWFHLGRLDLEEQFKQRYFDYYDNSVTDAKQNFKMAIKVDPDFAPAYVQLGMLNMYLHKIKAAKKLYRQAILLNPEIPEAYLGLGYSYLVEDNLEECLTTWKTLQEYYPDEPTYAALIGRINAQLENYSDALENFTNSTLSYKVRRDVYDVRNTYISKMVDFYYGLKVYSERREYFAVNESKLLDKGIVLLITEDYEKSTEVFNLVISSYSDNPLGYFFRGMAYEYQNELDFAHNDYSATIDLDEKIYDAYKKRGLIRYARQNPNGALRDFNRMLILDPTAMLVYRYKGMAKKYSRNYMGALLDYTAFINTDSSDYDVFIERGICNDALGERENALSDYQYAIYLSGGMLSNKLENTINRVSMMLMENADTTATLKLTKRAVKINPNNDFARNIRAIIFMKRMQYDSAKYELEEALNFGGVSVSSLLLRGKLKLSIGENAEARSDFDMLIANDSKYGEAYYYRAIANYISGNTAESEGDLAISKSLGFVLEEWDLPFAQPELFKE